MRVSTRNRDKLKVIFTYGTATAVIFAVLYYCSNYLASLSATHAKLYTDWELQIPFVPIMIIPYVSINLLILTFAVKAREANAIKYYCYSMVICTVFASIIFVLFPGQLGFSRQLVDGYECVYSQLYSMDRPFNLYPSLHVTYSFFTFLAISEQVKNRKLRVIFLIWTLAIIISVLLVHQHHIFDIITGLPPAILSYRFVYLRYKLRGR